MVLRDKRDRIRLSDLWGPAVQIRWDKRRTGCLRAGFRPRGVRAAGRQTSASWGNLLERLTAHRGAEHCPAARPPSQIKISTRWKEKKKKNVEAAGWRQTKQALVVENEAYICVPGKVVQRVAAPCPAASSLPPPPLSARAWWRILCYESVCAHNTAPIHAVCSSISIQRIEAQLFVWIPGAKI